MEHSGTQIYETSWAMFKRVKKKSESVTSRAMPRVGLREVIYVPLLLALSTNPAVATKDLQTDEKETKLLPQPQTNLNEWKEKSATIIHRFPGLLTKSVGGKFALRFLNLTETKTERNKMKEKVYGMIRTDTLGRLCKMLNHMRLKVVKRITRATLKPAMKHKMMKYRMRGLLPKMFSRVHVPRSKEGRNKKVKSLARHCFHQTEPTKVKAKKEFNMITI